MKHKRSILQIALGGIVAIAIVALLLLSAAHQFLSSWDPLSDTARIHQQTETILQAAIYSPTAPSKLGVCGEWLPRILNRNNNQYSIVIVGVWGNYASPIPGGTGSITAVVHVVFPDGTRVEMQYYAYTLDLCRLIQDSSEPS